MCRRLICLVTLALMVGPVSATWAASDSSLVGWWKLDETAGIVAKDSSAMHNDGEVIGGATWGAGQVNGALVFDGSNGYVSMPIGGVISTLTSATLMIWANPNQTGSWVRLFDIGTGTNVNMFLTPAQGTTGAMRFAITTGGNGAESQLTAGSRLATGWHHVAVAIDGETMTMEMFLDGESIQTANTNTVPADMGETTQNWLARSQYGADGYYSGSLDDFRIYNIMLTPEEIAVAMTGAGPVPGVAGAPNPADEAVDVRPDAVLSWNAGEFAATHDVYLGTNADDVNNASRTNPMGLLVSQNQTAMTYDPPGKLVLGQTYYWRIDEVNAPPTSSQIFKGSVWSFTAEPVAYLITDVNATANIPPETGSEIDKAVNGAGVREDGGHSVVSTDMWRGIGKVGDDVNLQFAFDRVYKLREVLIWNYNHQYEQYLGFSVKDITVEYSADGETWTTLGDYTLPQGAGQVSFQATPIDFGGAPAQQVRIIVNSNYGGGGFGMSEVQFYQIPTSAREPQPQAGAVGVSPSTILSWRPGREAGSHEVHVGTDANAVAAGEALVDTVGAPSYDTAPLNLMMGTKYYWMVVEVNDAETPAAWASAVWDFNTPDFIAVDDFESYDDEEGTRIFDAWVDGFGVAGNGSQVGNNDPPYAESNNIHPGDGEQGMPFTYGLEGETTSEATLTFASPQDWTRAGATTLVLWFRGELGNTASQLYLKVNSTRVNYNGSANSLTVPVWKQWNVDLASLGAAAKSVRTLTIGVSGSGTGTFYVDDIRLYRDAPPATGAASDPGTANLVAYYPMSDNVNDASGNNRNGTAETGSSFSTGPQGYGRAIAFDGTSGHVTLPVGTLIQSLSSATFASWVNFSAPAGSDWERIFDFGTGTTNYVFLSARQAGSDSMTFGILATGRTETRVVAPERVPAGWHHVAVVIDSATMNIDLYLDGTVVGSNTTDTLPRDLGETTNNWLGRSPWANDEYYTGLLDEFRIYNRALTAGEVQYLAGDR
ncbi:MAG: discoidin domain-containing protein [Sedimentisphaerales bacterium]|nr:discoidin domain-containing protein [Sedimentisphaerales bacterium]